MSNAQPIPSHSSPGSQLPALAAARTTTLLRAACTDRTPTSVSSLVEDVSIQKPALAVARSSTWGRAARDFATSALPASAVLDIRADAMAAGAAVGRVTRAPIRVEQANATTGAAGDLGSGLISPAIRPPKPYPYRDPKILSAKVPCSARIAAPCAATHLDRHGPSSCSHHGVRPAVQDRLCGAGSGRQAPRWSRPGAARGSVQPVPGGCGVAQQTCC